MNLREIRWEITLGPGIRRQTGSPNYPGWAIYAFGGKPEQRWFLAFGWHVPTNWKRQEWRTWLQYWDWSHWENGTRMTDGCLLGCFFNFYRGLSEKHWALTKSWTA